MPGCKIALETLVKMGHELFIMSFCGKNREVESRQALDAIKHLIPESNWVFVRDRKLKSVRCSELGLDVMIDDRLDILQHFVRAQVPRVTKQLIWFDCPVNNRPPAGIAVAHNWAEVITLFSADSTPSISAPLADQ
jgi:hypothetical protein